MMHTSDGQPDVGSPNTTVLTIVKMISTNARKQNSSPSTETNASGAVENARIPSREYRNSFQKVHVVSPLLRSIFSYFSDLV